MIAVRRTLVAFALMLVVSVPARAETILLSSGAFNWIGASGPASVTMSGSNFSFVGTAAAPFGGVFGPWLHCSVPECTAGTTVDLFSRFTTTDIPGTAIYGGQTYRPGSGIDAASNLDARWSGNLLIPTTFTGGVLTAPFTFAGEFYIHDMSAGPVINLLGAGTASLSFAPSPVFSGAYDLLSVRYEFDSAAPVPEPTSMLLIGSGLAGLAALRRRRNRGGDAEG